MKPDESKLNNKVLKDNPVKVEPKVENEIKEKKAEIKAKEEKADKLLQQLEEQKEAHQQIIEEQKEVLEKMKQHLEAEEEAKKKDDVVDIENAQGVPVQNQEPIGKKHCIK